MAGGRDHHLLGARDLGRHVVGRGQEWRVVGADHHQRRHLDAGQGLHHAGVALGQHAARGPRQAGCVAMADAGALGAHLLQHAKAFAVETLARLVGALVPGIARIVLLEAGAGVDDQECAHPLGMAAVKRQRHVVAERQAADNSLVRADSVEQRRDIGDRECLAIGRRVFRVIGLAVAAHVPEHELVVPRKCRNLSLPHG